jgi:preprotein translocase subunit SecA
LRAARAAGAGRHDLDRDLGIPVRLLSKQGFAHQVLNAKQHEREAHVIAQAGRPGTVTIATNMAGRGTDIVLGGNLEAELAAPGRGAAAWSPCAAARPAGQLPGCCRSRTARSRRSARPRAAWQQRHDQVIGAGGLHIIGTERHESRRIDNQLRGRSGRQGDPGSSRFYLSMEDNLMRIFGDPTRTKRLLQFAGMKEGEVIESGMLTRQIEKAQRKVESHNFDIRKQLLLFDDVANDQRKVIYQQRTEILGTADMSAAITEMFEEAAAVCSMSSLSPTACRRTGIWRACRKPCAATSIWIWSSRPPWRAEPELEQAALRTRVLEAVASAYQQKVERTGAPIMRHVERDVVLRTLDQHWRDHLAAMDYLRQGIHLRGYAQKDYRFEYKREAFELFSAMLGRVKFDTVSMLAKVEVRTQEQIDREEAERRERLMRALQAQHAEAQPLLGIPDVEAPIPPPPGPPSGMPAAEPLEPVAPFVRSDRKVGRNEPCPCGSGRKYKHCHGALAGNQ